MEWCDSLGISSFVSSVCTSSSRDIGKDDRRELTTHRSREGHRGRRPCPGSTLPAHHRERSPSALGWVGLLMTSSSLDVLSALRGLGRTRAH
jgi:hypothetical protein